MTDDQLFEEWDKTQVNNVLYVDYPNITAWLKAAFLDALRIGREQEREECAKVAEDTAVPWDGYEQGLAGQYLAAAIRAREEKDNE